MELKSDPKFDTINVTDIDIAFPGDLQTYTLRDGVDSFSYADDDDQTLVIKLGTVGIVRLYLEHAHWSAIRTRSIRVAVAPDAPKAKEQAAHADERTPDAL